MKLEEFIEAMAKGMIIGVPLGLVFLLILGLWHATG